MKIAPIIFLALVALTSCYARTVESICNKGPDVYCATEEYAALCDQLQFCSNYNLAEVRMEKVHPTIPEAQNPGWYWWG